MRGARQVNTLSPDAGRCIVDLVYVVRLCVHVQADVLGREVLVPQETESVLLGAAMLAMSAAR